MRQHLLYAIGTSFILVACSDSDQNASKVAVLKAENLLLKQELAALGKDTIDVLSHTTSSVSTTGTRVSSTPDLPATPSAGTGMWQVKHYVDDFGSPTKDGYIATETPIQGTFSNSATQDSDLIVQFLFDKDLTMSIKLYEYARNNPVKAYGSENYAIKVRDKDGKTYSLSGTNYESDRLTLDKASARKLHAVFLKGGKIQFVINESDTPTTEYKFTVDNADGYLNARKELKKS